MGYYTRYTLTAEPPYLTRMVPLKDKVTESHLLTEEERERLVEDTYDPVQRVREFVHNEVGYGDVFEDTCKWYDHDEHMKLISTQMPDVVFTLRGEGEESGDLWVKHFKNGKMQAVKAQITYEPFDEAQLS